MLYPQLPSPAPGAVAVPTRSPVVAGAPGPAPPLTASAELPAETCSADPQVPSVAAGGLWPQGAARGGQGQGPVRRPPGGTSGGWTQDKFLEAGTAVGARACGWWGLAPADPTF